MGRGTLSLLPFSPLSKLQCLWLSSPGAARRETLLYVGTVAVAGVVGRGSLDPGSRGLELSADAAVPRIMFFEPWWRPTAAYSGGKRTIIKGLNAIEHVMF